MGLTPAEPRSAEGPRIGLYGGAFDPPHNAHVALARTALQQLALDELHILPTGQAWHKARPLSDATHRLAMARLAFEDLPGVAVDPLETLRTGPSYTIDTLRELQAARPGARWFLLVGQDQADALDRWRDWPEILQRATISIAQRPKPLPSGAEGAATAAFDPGQVPGAQVVHLQMPPLDLSATHIRALAAAGQRVDHLVPAAVARYIDHHHLYRPA